MAALVGTKRPVSSLQDPPSPHTHKRRAVSSRLNSEPAAADTTQRSDTVTRSLNVSPARSNNTGCITRNFEDGASIVLIGIRGCGKTTLGVIASAVFQRRLVETHSVFLEATGHSTSVHRRLVGPLQHQRTQLEVLSNVLSKHEKGCIIVCGDEALDRRCQRLLTDYRRSHPVVQILRDSDSIQDYLSGLDHAKVTDLLHVSDPLLRRCSNYEFFNTSDNAKTRSTLANEGRFYTPFLTLKKVEKHFLKFIALITASNSIATLEAAYPLSNTAVERRSNTYAVVLQASHVAKGGVDIEHVESGSDAIELLLDAEYMAGTHSSSTPRISQLLAEVRRSTIVPIIYNVAARCCSTPNGGSPQYQTDSRVRQAYIEAVSEGLRLGPEFLTVDLDLDDEEIRNIIEAKGTTKIIGDLYGQTGILEWSDVFWSNAYDRAMSLGCDIVRLRRQGEPLEDNLAAQSFRESIQRRSKDQVPLIAYNVGHHGRFSAVMNTVLTSVRYATENGGPSDLTNTANLTARECTSALASCFAYDPMKFFIIGASITYSLSPSMHNAGFDLCGLPHSYTTYQTSSLNSIRTLMEDSAFGGASITLPFKLDIIGLTTSLSKHARAIGAVNTLIPIRKLRADGTMPDELHILEQPNKAGKTVGVLGENTDWIGIRACIRRGLSPVNAVRPQTTGLVCGSGGMARAAVYAMLHLGVKNVFIFSRTLAHAERLVRHYEEVGSKDDLGLSPHQGHNKGPTDFRMHVLPSLDTPWPNAFRRPTIIVSCIPTHAIGNDPAPNFVMPPDWLQSPTGGVVLEVAYKTLHTPLLQQVRAEGHRGWVAMDGLDLLPEQGFAQFELFTGRRAPRRLMREQVLRQFRDSGVQDPSLINSRLAQIDDQEP